MKRHETKIEDETVYVEDREGWLEVGAIADVFAEVGGETFEVEYDRKQATYAEWLDTDEDHVMTIDVRETIADMSYPSSFVEALADRDLTADGDDPPERTAYFADVLADVWASKGDLSHRDDDPFGVEDG